MIYTRLFVDKTWIPASAGMTQWGSDIEVRDFSPADTADLKVSTTYRTPSGACP